MSTQAMQKRVSGQLLVSIEENAGLKKINNVRLIVLTSIFIVIFDNWAFFKNVASVFHFTSENIGFLSSLAISLTSLIILLLLLVSSKYTTKTLLIFFLLVSSVTNYFMNEYGVVIDHTMIQNMTQTNFTEVMELFSFKLFLYFLFLGLLPSIFIYKVNIIYDSWTFELKSKLMSAGICLLIIASSLFAFGNFYASFFREHKALRYLTNPTYIVYSSGKYINQTFKSIKSAIIPIGLDAKIPIEDTGRELVILVVGETARADRFSLNGYEKETNPLLKKEDVISFVNFFSCGTSTATSVPCMFSFLPRKEYDNKKGSAYTNLLDVLKIANVNILWRDNNSSSKGVALRVPYEEFRSPDVNSICDVECRDEGMLVGLQEYIDEHKTGDILIVLHQMGNHGPAYYKRYPKSYEIFQPACKTNHLEHCSANEVNNAYDNAIRYTDYFLSKTIDFLKNNSNQFETVMFYVSDHGESLGENGLYLHGMPYFIAPEAQKHVPAIMWFGNSFQIDKNALKAKAGRELSHDNIFHTVLGLMEIESEIYREELDILRDMSDRS